MARKDAMMGLRQILMRRRDALRQALAGDLSLLKELRQQLQLSMVIVSHDIGLVGSLAGRMVVMRGGRIVESGSTADLLTSPADAYTRHLLSSVLRLDRQRRSRTAMPAPASRPRKMKKNDTKRAGMRVRRGNDCGPA